MAMEFGRSNKKAAPRSLAAPAVSRLRIRWGKNDSHRLLSHLDNIKSIEEAVRRSGIPASFSHGTHPRMKISFGPPLPMGFTSECEFVDITLDRICTGRMIDSVRKAMPEGFELLEAKTVFAKTASLSESLNRVIYNLRLENEINTARLKEQAVALLEKVKLEVLRKTKSGEAIVDIRPAIFEIGVNENMLQLLLGIGPGGYARPTEVARLLLGIDETQAAALPFHRQEMFRQTADNRRIAGIEL